MLCAAPGPIAVLVDFEQLNCKRNSVLVEKQQFSIACRSLTVADSKMRSSHILDNQCSNRYVKINTENMQIKLTIKILTKTVNIAGENELTCLTPLPTLILKEVAVFHLTDT